MVKQLRILYALLRLMRYDNLIIMVITQYFIRFFVLKPLLAISDFSLQLNELQFLILVLSTVFLAASGYIINDYFDRKTDLINRPGRVIVGRIISMRYAMAFHMAFTIIGLSLGFYLSYSIHRLGLSMIFFFVSVVLWLYSTTYKRQIIVGNLIISLLVGMIPMMVLLFEFPMLAHRYQLYVLAFGNKLQILIFWVGSYAFFAFITNLIREIIKDMEDFEGDFIFGRQTIPIVWGMKTAKLIVAGLILLTLVLLCCLLFFQLRNTISFIYIPLFIFIPMIMLAFLTYRADSKNRYHHLSQLIKLVMLAGLMYCPLIKYVVLSLK